MANEISNKLQEELSNSLAEREKKYGVIREPEDNIMSFKPNTAPLRAWLEKNAELTPEEEKELSLGKRFAGGLQKDIAKLLLPQNEEERMESVLSMAMMGGPGGGKGGFNPGKGRAVSPGGFKEGFLGTSLSPEAFEGLSTNLVKAKSPAEKIAIMKRQPSDVIADYFEHPNRSFREAADAAMVQKARENIAKPEQIPGSKKHAARALTEKYKEYEGLNKKEADDFAAYMRGESGGLSAAAAKKIEDLQSKTPLERELGQSGAGTIEELSVQYRTLKEQFKNDPDLLQLLDEVAPAEVKNIGKIQRD